jgi:DNA primase
MIDSKPSQEMGKEVAHILSDYLLGNEPAIQYLEQRGISRKLIEEERIGYCPPFLNYYWSPLMRGRITVAISDAADNIIAFAGRQYEPSAQYAIANIRRAYESNITEAEKKVAMWLRGKWINETYPKKNHLFNLNYAKHYIRMYGYVIIVEGYFDALVLDSKGFKNVVAICSSSLSERQATLLSKYCDHAVILLDGDVAGEKGASKMIPILEEVEMYHHRVCLPQGYDPDEFVIKKGGKQLERAIYSMIEDGKTELIIKLNEGENK